jgi:CRISPR-associated protein (TIGR03984 family)
MYEAIKIKSEVTPITQLNSWSDLTNAFKGKEAKAVVWYFDKIEFHQLLSNGKWDREPRPDLDEELVRVRIFNSLKEVHVWRSKGKLKGRLRIDDDKAEKKDAEYVKAEQIMNGTPPYHLHESGKFLIAEEASGIHYELPFKNLIKKVDSKKRITLVTRNYIGYNELGQAGYVDSRFEKIEIIDK